VNARIDISVEKIIQAPNQPMEAFGNTPAAPDATTTKE
jgi:hypothetical protein